MPPEPRANDRASYYTMKTAGLAASQAPGHSRTNSQSLFSNKATGAPLSSPRPPHSVGQPHPPKMSPSTSRGGVVDARTPSPNYFGLALDPSADPRESALLPHENWSTPTSSVKSFAAAIPKHLPLDANPEFEAFRRQIDANRGRSGFSLSNTHFNITSGGPYIQAASTPSAQQRPRPPRSQTHGSDLPENPPTRPSLPTESGSWGPGDNPFQSVVENGSQRRDAPHISVESRFGTKGLMNPPVFLGLGKPPSHEWEKLNSSITQASGRLGRKTETPSPTLSQQGNSDKSPTQGCDGPSMIPPAELKHLLEKSKGENILLLDIRVSPQFAQSRIQGALNLCIPTTLLKRATFNLQKLQQTFQADRDQDKFAKWQTSSHLVVYDAASSDRRDATSALNMIKKFTNEGYSGTTSILRGGFNAFALAYPNLVDRSSNMISPTLSLGGGGPATNGARSNVPPVIGGVMLPTTNDKIDPFFSNIRQNQDLVDGVGQMDVGVPAGLDKDRLPRWLREAIEINDHGKRVSDKFLRIELTEQSRMKLAYAAFASSKNHGPQTESQVRLSGVEQGGKNRYKDILPFEHARVKLQGRPEGGCDYVNASHIQAKRSYKRYIASQGPLPATFEDFWSVVWDNDVRVIVMLTAESEGGQLKCHPYWKGRDFGSIRLRLLSEKKISLDIDKHRSGSTAPGDEPATTSSNEGASTFPEGGRRRANTTTTLHPKAPGSQSGSAQEAETPYVTIRKFALSHAMEPFAPIREITHLHYTSWPDFGAPAQPSHLLALVELANVMQRAALPNDVTVAASQPQPNHDSGSYFDPSPPLRSDSLATTVQRASYDAPEPAENSRPMLVHCSAGCGRTGAFCTVDSVIDMLKRQRQQQQQHAATQATSSTGQRCSSNKRTSQDGWDDDDEDSRSKRLALQQDRKADMDPDGDVTMAMDEGFVVLPRQAATQPPVQALANGFPGFGSAKESINTAWLEDDGIDLIAQTVEDFRGQRLSMVQSLRQFVLCYETVLEWIWRVEESGSAGGSLLGRARGRSGSLAF
ncbi:putative tyrosine-protein phosphatase [Triangularia setosa]|uniref:protein-tyrosine-phosphatase n=1 Tax=Triangularia setosa TaxID=2587417 RepID=A0AAN7A558_9PEZI|nr:putative tyrosine-protein phosphatase [Podospora setosa]